MPLTQQSSSLQFVEVPISTVDAVNPTADPVQMAFVADGVQPGAGDWKSALWRTQTVGPEGQPLAQPIYLACCNVGPGGTVTLAAGSYIVWVKITDNPEAPVLRSGELVIE